MEDIMRFSSRGGLCVLFLSLGLTLAEAPAQAGEAQEQIFATGVLDAIALDEHLVYRHDRQVGFSDERMRALENGRVELTMALDESGAREALVVLTEDGRVRRLNPFPADAGNPLLMVFMETAVHGMAGITGGSPFYIRNRMRDALRGQDEGTQVRLVHAGTEITAERFHFRPFAQDPNRDRMGAFADLELQFVVSAELPGQFAMLHLATGETPAGEPLLAESMTLEGVVWLD
ncbi:MAG: hypothetical protein EA339_14095 [Rhodobacteraceae bacterium]|nr:MAG: hypothetical protein EA339_14095 [Paracoccaceae bacterium]